MYERAGGYLQHDILGELGTGDADIDIRDPIQRFTQFTKTVTNDVNNQGVISLKRPDIKYILDQIQHVPHVKYKNPTAFVLGFWVTTRDGTINKDRFKKLVPFLPKL